MTNPAVHPGFRFLSVRRIGRTLKALGESGLNSEAAAVAEALVRVLNYPGRPPGPASFEGVDFGSLGPGELQADAVGDLSWRWS